MGSSVALTRNPGDPEAHRTPSRHRAQVERIVRRSVAVLFGGYDALDRLANVLQQFADRVALGE